MRGLYGRPRSTVGTPRETRAGDLLDGTRIDLTATSRGTNYDSSDLTICNFSADSGRVFAGMSGFCTITVTNAGFTARAAVETYTPGSSREATAR